METAILPEKIDEALESVKRLLHRSHHMKLEDLENDFDGGKRLMATVEGDWGLAAVRVRIRKDGSTLITAWLEPGPTDSIQHLEIAAKTGLRIAGVAKRVFKELRKWADPARTTRPYTRRTRERGWTVGRVASLGKQGDE